MFGGVLSSSQAVKQCLLLSVKMVQQHIFAFLLELAAKM